MEAGGSEGLEATALDASVIVAGLLSWHQRHEAAVAALMELLERDARLVLPVYSLVEAYAVMTRLPPPHRLSPKNAFEILSGSLRGRCTLVSVESAEAWALIGDLSERSVAGGMTYDALITAAARRGGASRILTLNRNHFERVKAKGLRISVPGEDETS